MEVSKLDHKIKRLHKRLPFLWNIYNYHLTFLTRDFGIYGKGFVIGFENDICRLVFWKETNSSIQPITDYMGKKTASFSSMVYSLSIPERWYSLTGLIYWLSDIEYETVKDVDKDLENLSQYLQLHMDKVIDLFRFPNEFDSKLEYYRNLHKENQITVEKIREERARLHALGQDSSLEVAIASLRGGKK